MRCASKGPEHDEVCVQRSKAYVGRRPSRPLGWAISPVITEEMKKQSHCNRGKSLPRKSKFPRHLRTMPSPPPQSQPNLFKVQIPTLILTPLTLLFLTISSPTCTFHRPHSAQGKWSLLSPSILTVLTAHRLLFIALQVSWVLTRLTGPPTRRYLSHSFARRSLFLKVQGLSSRSFAPFNLCCRLVVAVSCAFTSLRLWFHLFL